MLPTEIQLVLRVAKGTPLTAQEMDANLTRLRSAILGVSEEVKAGRIVFGDEPAPGERVGVIWIKPTGGAFQWNATHSRWDIIQDQATYEDLSAGSATAYEVTVPVNTPDLASLTGRTVTFISHAANTGAATLKINALSPIPLTTSTGAALASGQIPTGHCVIVLIDGTNARVLNTVADALPPILRELIVPTFDMPANASAVEIVIDPALPTVPVPHVVAVSLTEDSGWPVGTEIPATIFFSDRGAGNDEEDPLFTIGATTSKLTVARLGNTNGTHYATATGALKDVVPAVFDTYFRLKAYLRYMPAS